MPFIHDRVCLRASADGRLFTAWNLGVSPSGIHVLAIEGDRVRNAYEHNSAGYLCPDEHGQRIYSAAGVYTSQAKRVGNGPAQGTALVAAVQGPLYVRVAGGNPVFDRNLPRTLTVHLAGETAPLAVLPDLAERLGVPRFPPTTPGLNMDQRHLPRSRRRSHRGPAGNPGLRGRPPFQSRRGTAAVGHRLPSGRLVPSATGPPRPGVRVPTRRAFQGGQGRIPPRFGPERNACLQDGAGAVDREGPAR